MTGFDKILSGLAVATMAIGVSIALPAGAQTSEDASNPWQKFCVAEGDSEVRVCVTRQEARNQEGQRVASALVRQIDGQPPRLLFEVPTGVILPPGVGYTIDESELARAVFIICTQHFCSAEAEIDTAFIDQLKAGSNLVMQVMNHTEEVVAIGFTLVGFTAAIDGEGQDLNEYNESRSDVQRGLQERAEEARRQLQEQQEAGQ
ncbi:MAG: invasion associated locus B family protein [Pseudomonadota bacterium]